jgi:uncharacterized membrane protein YqjE
MLLMMLLLLLALSFVLLSLVLSVVTLFQKKYKFAFFCLLAAVMVAIGLFFLIWADMQVTDRIIKENPEAWTEKVW